MPSYTSSAPQLPRVSENNHSCTATLTLTAVCRPRGLSNTGISGSLCISVMRTLTVRRKNSLFSHFFEFPVIRKDNLARAELLEVRAVFRCLLP